MSRRSKTKPMIEDAPVNLGAALGALRRRDEAILEQMDEDIAKAAVNGGRWGGVSPEALSEAVESPQAHDLGSFD